MTDPPRSRRRLAAILMADVAGFSRLMGRDEEGTTARILAFHDAVQASVEQYGGRVVATAGDSVFGDFDSIVEALACAEEIQKSLHEANDGRDPSERIEARIGLHLGDVIVEEYNVFGDGVNIAARLEQLADPGGIVISEAVYQQVKGRSGLPFEDMGTQSLKNIDQPVKLYRIPPTAFDPDYEPVEIAPASPGSERGDAIRDTIRSAIEDVAAEVKDAIRESREEDDGSILGDQAQEPDADKASVVGPVVDAEGDAVIAFTPGFFLMVALGILLVIARTSGWSSNGVYPFLGCWILGVALGGGIRRITKRRGFQRLFAGIGLAAGAFFFERTVIRVLLWLLAAAIFGSGTQSLAGRERTRK